MTGRPPRVAQATRRQGVAETVVGFVLAARVLHRAARLRSGDAPAKTRSGLVTWNVGSADEAAPEFRQTKDCFRIVPRLLIADPLFLNSRLPSFNQKQGHGPSKVHRQSGMTRLEWNSRAPPSMGVTTLVAQRTNTLNDALAIPQNRFEHFFLVLRWCELQDSCGFRIEFRHIPFCLPLCTAVLDDMFADLFK